MPTDAQSSGNVLALLRFLAQQQQAQQRRRAPARMPNQNGVLLSNLRQANSLARPATGDFGRNAADVMSLLASLQQGRYAGAVQPGLRLLNTLSPGMIDPKLGGQIGDAASLYQNIRDKNYLGAAGSGINLANSFNPGMIPGGEVLGPLGAAYNVFRPGLSGQQRALNALMSAPQLYQGATMLGSALGLGGGAASGAAGAAGAAGAGAGGIMSVLGPLGMIASAGMLIHKLTGGGKENPKVQLGYGDGNITAWGFDSPFGKIGFKNIQTPHEFGQSLQKYFQSFDPLDRELAARMTPQQLDQVRQRLANTQSFEFAFPPGGDGAGEQVVAQFLRDKYAAIYDVLNPAAAQQIRDYRGHSSGLMDAIAQLHTDPTATRLNFKEAPDAKRTWAPPGGNEATRNGGQAGAMANGAAGGGQRFGYNNAAGQWVDFSNPVGGGGGYFEAALRNQAMLDMGLDPTKFYDASGRVVARPDGLPYPDAAPAQPAAPVQPVQPAAQDPFNLGAPQQPTQPAQPIADTGFEPNTASGLNGRRRAPMPGQDEWYSDNYNPFM